MFDRVSRGQVEPKIFTVTLNPLTRICTKILSLHEGILRAWPQLHAPASKRDMSKWYEFHRDNGHEMDACKDLKQEIEGCVQQGVLK